MLQVGRYVAEIAQSVWWPGNGLDYQGIGIRTVCDPTQSLTECVLGLFPRNEATA